MAELFGLNPNEYENVSLRDLNLKHASLSELERQDILLLSQMLLLTPRTLLKYRDIGKVSLNNILVFLDEIKKGNVDLAAYKIAYLHNIPIAITRNRNNIVKGDFSFIQNERIPTKTINKYIRAQQEIGEEIALLGMNCPQKIIPICSALLNFNKEHTFISNRLSALNSMFDFISENRKINNIYDYIRLYPTAEYNKDTLNSIFNDDQCVLTSEQKKEIILDSEKYIVLMNFLQWLKLPPSFYIRALMNKVLNNAIKRKIIELRIEGCSYQEIAEENSKGNVQRIITKHNKIIKDYFLDNNCLAAFILLSLDLGNKRTFTDVDLINEFGELAPKVKYFYSLSPNPKIHYNLNENLLILK